MTPKAACLCNASGIQGQRRRYADAAYQAIFWDRSGRGGTDENHKFGVVGLLRRCQIGCPVLDVGLGEHALRRLDLDRRRPVRVFPEDVNFLGVNVGLQGHADPVRLVKGVEHGDESLSQQSTVRDLIAALRHRSLYSWPAQCRGLFRDKKGPPRAFDRWLPARGGP